MNIRVNSVHPGAIAPPYVSPYLEDPESRQTVLARTLMKRSGESAEITKVVAFLASDTSSFMTGSEVGVDGGFLST
ncbi:NAD(P)-dependent dehydrogenase (short-subunit alcohol dehydrogenase family) [Rhizobium sp. BK275]|nr:NAD(P)-dependent dehydrogenase (short-subunit alcohol dehydrogenase family) [Rhizobium sp. BK275]MBB3406702.1 NAD(P)-dependent dehydrogenase (short-subunit alcohol dehydrogenase family) [Rhizobium sp. BK316]